MLLAGGAGGDFSTLSLDERLKVAAAIAEQADGRVPVVMGAQTTGTRELVHLARADQRLGAECDRPVALFPRDLVLAGRDRSLLP